MFNVQFPIDLTYVSLDCGGRGAASMRKDTKGTYKRGESKLGTSCCDGTVLPTEPPYGTSKLITAKGNCTNNSTEIHLNGEKRTYCLGTGHKVPVRNKLALKKRKKI